MQTCSKGLCKFALSMQGFAQVCIEYARVCASLHCVCNGLCKFALSLQEIAQACIHLKTMKFNSLSNCNCCCCTRISNPHYSEICEEEQVHLKPTAKNYSVLKWENCCSSNCSVKFCQTLT